MAMKDPKTFIKYTTLNINKVTDMLNETIKLFNWNKAGEYVLDIGCGPGDITSTIITKFLPENSKIMGVDISPEMIEYANNNYSSDRIHFKLMDICDLNLFTKWKCEEFSTIFTISCLQRVQDLKIALHNINKLLQPNGIMYCETSCYYPTVAILKYLAEQPKYANYSEALMDRTKSFDLPKIIPDYMKDLGYDVLFCTDKVEELTFESFEAIMEFYESILFLSELIPESLANEAIMDIKNNLIQLGFYKSEDGYSFKIYQTINIARKPGSKC